MTDESALDEVLSRDWMHCAVCGYTLEHRGGEWFHARDLFGAEDHVAVPVPKGTVQQNVRCDICDGEPATHELDANNFDMPYTQSRSVGGWAFCAECAATFTRAMKERSPTRLVVRGLEAYRRRGARAGRQEKDWLNALYTRLMLNATSDVRERV